MAPDLAEIRRAILLALFSDDVLFEQVVLKGGNALALVHGLGDRGSVDLDFSMYTEFDDLDDATRRIKSTLERTLSEAGLIVFDFRLEEKPTNPTKALPDWWGGYQVTFKLIERDKYDPLDDLQKQRMQSIAVDSEHNRKFKIDFSKHEYCAERVAVEIDNLTIHVYSLEMIVAEKLRAICQQHESYPYIPPDRKRARARDFFDIHQILTDKRREVTMLAKAELMLVPKVFGAKRVDLGLLRRIPETRAFHAADWRSVTASVRGEIGKYDTYFDFVTALAIRISDALGIE